MKSEQRNRTKDRITLPLTALFIILKLCGVISWPWLWVLSPLWIGFALAFAIVVIFSLIYVATMLIDGLIQ